MFREPQSLMDRMNAIAKTRDDLEFILTKLHQLSYFTIFIEQFLQGSNRDVLLDLCSHVRMEVFKAGDIIFKEGDTSNNKLYMVYQGTCMLMRKKTLEILDMEDISPRKSKTPKASANKDKISFRTVMNVKRITQTLISKNQTARLTPEEKDELKSQYGECLRTMTRGDGFGEIALLQNVNRSLTVAAETAELYLVVLHKDDFQVVQKQFEQQMKEKQRVLFNIFKDVKDEYSSTRLQAMIYSFDTIELERNQYVTEEDTRGSDFYILQQGEVMISKYRDGKQVCICIVGSGYLIGEEIVLRHHINYDFTVQVISNSAKLMVISVSQFHGKFPHECKRKIIKDYRVKKESRLNMLERITQRKNELVLQNSLQQTVVEQPQQFDLGQFLDKVEISAPTLNRLVSPSARNYCIQQIVKTQILNYKKSLPTLSSVEQIEQAAQPKEPLPYDFGKNEVEETKQRNYIFQCRMNIIRPSPKYKEPDEQIFQNIIKKRYLKGVVRQNRSDYVRGFTSVTEKSSQSLIHSMQTIRTPPIPKMKCNLKSFATPTTRLTSLP